MWALKKLGVTQILSIATSGGIRDDFGPAALVVPDQIIDYTHGRESTYHDGTNGEPVRHIDFTEPYCPKTRDLCKQAASKVGEALIDGGIYAVVQGPRLETAAEINRLERDGATMVGMTGMPEASLARELDMSYAAICPVANYAAGRGSSIHGIQYEEIGAILNGAMQRVRGLIEQVVTLHAD